MSRPSWDAYFLGIAEAVSARADCTRRKVGAVVVKDNRIVSTGYNGSPAGEKGCLSDGACPRGKHFPIGWTDSPECYTCRVPYPCPEASTPGSDYSNCIARHAERNAIDYAEEYRWSHPNGYNYALDGATIYITREPCADCLSRIGAARIVRVVWPEGEL